MPAIDLHTNAAIFGIIEAEINKEVTRMKILIVYDSVFGNTAKLAEAVAKALDSRAVKVSECTESDLQSLDMLIAGSPTRMFKPMPSMKASIKGLPDGSLKGVKVAAFDTRFAKKESGGKLLNCMSNTFGYAAEKMLKSLEKKGGTAAAGPIGFFVSGNEGPIIKDEEKRAADWAI
jgi:flavodoxin